MVKRGVIQVISKGTVVDFDMLNEHDNNYIASILDYQTSYIVTYTDISTGYLALMEIEKNKDKLLSSILNLGIKEIILSDNSDLELIDLLKNNYGIEINICSEYLEKKYEEVYKDIKDIKYITGIKHLFYY